MYALGGMDEKLNLKKSGANFRPFLPSALDAGKLIGSLSLSLSLLHSFSMEKLRARNEDPRVAQ